MKTRLSTLMLFLLALAVTPAFAQDDPTLQGDGGQGTQTQRGGARRFSVLNRNNQSSTRLLFRTDVQNDLQLTQEQKDKINGLRSTMRGSRNQPTGDGQQDPASGSGQSPTQTQPATRRGNNIRQQLQAILTPDQQKRLDEINNQLQGGLVLLRPEIQTSLNLTSDQTSKVTDLNKKYLDAQQQLQDKVDSNTLQRREARSLAAKNDKALADELLKVLTPDQSTKLKTLFGKTFVATSPGDR